MKNLIIPGRLFYAIGLAGIAMLHFFYPGFLPVILPIPAEAAVHYQWLAYLIAVLLLAGSLLIALGIFIYESSMALALIMLILVLVGHLPNRLMNAPGVLAMWTDALKLLALSGGALIIARHYVTPGSRLIRFTHAGQYFFAAMLMVFGISHFVYADFVKLLVPAWIPGNLFWTYVAAVALIGSGISFILGIGVKWVSLALAMILLIWLLVLHIPRAISMDTSTDPNEIVSVFECLAFCGMAMLLYEQFRPTTTKGKPSAGSI